MKARQSTARTFMIGPILDADGAAVTDAVIADVKVSKNGAAPAALDGSATLTHRHTGNYSLAATANDFDTVGTAQFGLDDTVNACAPKDFQVIEEAVYDRDFAAAATGIIGTAQTGDNFARIGAPIGASISEDLSGVTTIVSGTSSQVAQLFNGLIGVASTVNDAGATTTGFNTSITGFADGSFEDKVLVFTNGNLDGQSRVITSYTETNGAMTFDEPWTEAPANGDGFLILAIHVHSESRIHDVVHDGTTLRGTADTGGSTTSIPIKTLDLPGGLTVTDQLKGRVILFTNTTTTAALRGQGAPIDGSTTTHITLAAGDALTTAPAEDDDFRII